MIATIWAIVSDSEIARMIGVAVMAVLGVLGYGKLKQRQGAKGQKAKQDAANAKETIEALETRNEVEANIARDGSAKQRLRDRWSR